MAPGRPLVELEGVWRRYRRGGRARSIRRRLQRGIRARDDWFWALRDVSLSVEPGVATAIVGRNGAGKSTLLRLIGGVGRPDRGTVRADARMAGLLDLGHEFHLELSGRQNAEIAAVVAGLTRREFRRRFADIVAFAELEDFIDDQVRTYSDGMRARLAFSVVAHLDPEVLLVDEVLAVGDESFQRRSIERIESLRDRGTAIVFVSHDLTLARSVCEQAVWLHHGEVAARGDCREVVRAYLAHARAPVPDIDDAPVKAELRDVFGAPADAIGVGDGLLVRADVDAKGQDGNLRVLLRPRDGDTVLVDTSITVGGDRVVRELVLERLDLAPGAYTVEVALFSEGWDLCRGARTRSFEIRGVGSDDALLAPRHEWRRAE